MKEMKEGDSFQFVQQNGQVIEIWVRHTGVLVKARDVGTELKIYHHSGYTIEVESVTMK